MPNNSNSVQHFETSLSILNVIFKRLYKTQLLERCFEFPRKMATLDKILFNYCFKDVTISGCKL